MAAIGLGAFAPANIRISGISTWKVKYAGDDGHYSLGRLKNGTIVAKTLEDTDSLQRNVPYLIDFEAKAKMMYSDKVAVLQKLPLLSGQMDHIITCIDGSTFKGAFGMFWQLNVDTAVRDIDVRADGQALFSHATIRDWADILGSPSPGSPDGGDALTGFAPATALPSGFSTFAIKPTTESTYEVTGPIKRGKFTATSIVEKDDLGQSFSTGAIKIDADFDILATAAEKSLLSAVTDVDWQITCKDGVIFTIDNSLGTGWEFHHDNDATGSQYIKYRASGTILGGAWAGIIS